MFVSFFVDLLGILQVVPREGMSWPDFIIRPNVLDEGDGEEDKVQMEGVEDVCGR